ncbi:unnamed protein product, partial [Polarella glacialis]
VISFVPQLPELSEVQRQQERKAHANLARLAANNDKMWLMLANLIERVRGGPHSAAKAMRKEMPSKPVADMAQEAPVSTTYLSTVELQHAAHEVSVLAASFSKELCRDEQEALAYLHMARIGDNHEKVMTGIKECLSGFNLSHGVATPSARPHSGLPLNRVLAKQSF